MFDIGGFELLVIAALALIVVGPKDLPGLIRNVGRWVARARSLAREFQSGMEDAARAADLDELNKIKDVGDEFKRDVSSLGSETQRMLDQPMGPASRDVPRQPKTETASDVAAPSVREVPVEPVDAPAPASTANGAAQPTGRDGGRDRGQDDDDAFLERFQRGVQGDR